MDAAAEQCQETLPAALGGGTNAVETGDEAAAA
jgi:hypothetical protein